MQTKTSTTPTNLPEVAKKLDEYVVSVIGADKINGFEKAFQMSTAIGKLKEILTTEYMQPIMQLQGTKLGFRTDKDKNRDGSKGPGYPIEVARAFLVALPTMESTLAHWSILIGMGILIVSSFPFSVHLISTSKAQLVFSGLTRGRNN